MNEQLQQALASILNKTASGVEAGAAFLQSEIPEVVSQLLLYKLVAASVESFILLSLILGFAFFVRLVCSSIKKEGVFYDEYGPGSLSIIGFMGLLCGGIASLISFIAIFCNIAVILKIWLAPKIYLIEYAASLAK